MEPETATFDWQRGSVAFPRGFSYLQKRGIDTFMGRFVSPDGKLEVRHDIGELAGEHGGIGAFTESLASGSRMKIAHGTTAEGKAYAAVSFADSGCANFFVEADRAEDTRVIDAIVLSFRPGGWMPSRLIPLLPEILRSDCRYRLNLPDWF